MVKIIASPDTRYGVTLSNGVSTIGARGLMLDIEGGHRSHEGRHFRGELDRAGKAQTETASWR